MTTPILPPSRHITPTVGPQQSAPRPPALRDTPQPSGGRLKFALNSIGSAVGVVVLLGAVQLAIPDEYKQYRPSAIYGDITGEMLAAEMDAQVRSAAAFAEGQKEGELKAQIHFENQLVTIKLEAEKQLTAYKAVMERTNKWYETLFGALGKSVEAGLQMEQEQARQRVAATSTSQMFSRLIVSVLDGMGTTGELLGDRQLSQYGDKADQLRRKMEMQLNTAAASGAGSQYNAIMNGIPNVGTLQVHQQQWLREAGVLP